MAAAVAHEEREALVVERAVVSEAAAFEGFGATAQPVVLGHAVNQQAFGFSGSYRLNVSMPVEYGERIAM